MMEKSEQVNTRAPDKLEKAGCSFLFHQRIAKDIVFRHPREAAAAPPLPKLQQTRPMVYSLVRQPT